MYFAATNQSFLLKMVTQELNGTAAIVTSVPCSAGSWDETCMVEVRFGARRELCGRLWFSQFCRIPRAIQQVNVLYHAFQVSTLQPRAGDVAPFSPPRNPGKRRTLPRKLALYPRR